MTTVRDCGVVFLGDFNLRDINWNGIQTPSAASAVSKEFVEFFRAHELFD